MKHHLRILHLEDDHADAELLKVTLANQKFDSTVTRVETRSEFEKALTEGKFDLIISDYTLPGFDGLSALEIAATKRPDTPFIFSSGTIGEERAIEALQRGATDYVLKDRPARLGPAIRRALAGAEAAREKRQAAERIQEQAELLDRAQDAICLLGMDHTVLYWNKSAERLYGWTAREAIGRNGFALLFQTDPARLATVQTCLSLSGEWHGEFQQNSKSGRRIIAESRWTLVRSGDGAPKAILIINTDVTEKRQIEFQLLRTQRLDSIGALAGGIAHDLNNCLTPVLVGLNVIGSEVTSEAGNKMLAVMLNCTQRGADMVRQILSFARGAAGEPTPLQIRHLIQDMARLVENTFPRSVEVQTHIAPELALVMGNPTQLNQVLLNLCVNARDAMQSGGQLRIEAVNFVLDQETARLKQLPSGNYVLLTVSDTGHGMAAEVLEKVFEPFFTTKEESRGTGLGLSTVLGIVKTHRGKVEVKSAVGKGSTISVYLPAISGVTASAVPPDAPEIPKGAGESILLVDDELAILEMTRLLLEAHGYNVATARNGEEAVALYREHRAGFNAVITDMMMPAMDGPNTIDALRQIDPGVKIIGISGLLAGSPLLGAGQAQVQAFLKKPFSTTDLLGTLRTLCKAEADAP